MYACFSEQQEDVLESQAKASARNTLEAMLGSIPVSLDEMISHYNVIKHISQGTLDIAEEVNLIFVFVVHVDCHLD